MFEVTSIKAITTVIKIYAGPNSFTPLKELFFFYRMGNKNSTLEVVFADPKEFLKVLRCHPNIPHISLLSMVRGLKINENKLHLRK